MAYYVLNKGFRLRGWKGLPFGLNHPNRRSTDFFDRDSYRVVYHMDGLHDIREEDLDEKQKVVLKRLVDFGMAHKTDGTETLTEDQQYFCYPGMHKKSVQWSITGRCNFNCRHCFMSAPDYKGEDLSLDQCVRIVNQLADNGIFNVAITGGEPLVSPHFYAILDEMKKREMNLETLYTNGKLVDDHLLDELDKRNMFPAFHISFDGVRWHDWLRGEKGAEEEAVRAFVLLKNRGFHASTSFCLHRHNIGDLRENINFLAGLGLKHIKMNVASPTGRWKRETEHFITQDEANEAITEYLPHYFEDGMPISVQLCTLLDINREKGCIQIPAQKYSGKEGCDEGFACGFIKNHMYISPKGKVLPCMTMGGTVIDSRFESILEKDLSDILSDSHYRNICMVKMGDCITHNEKCRECRYRLFCGAGCRACGCGETGTDYLAVDEECCRFFQNGWFEKAQELIEQYKDRLPNRPTQDEPEPVRDC